MLAAPLGAQTSNNLDFLSDLPDYAHLRTMLREYLNREAITRLEERRQQIARLSTPEEVAKRQAYVREHMIRDLGGFPARTPLNARVVGTLDRDGYKIEKVIFESQPHFYVTGNLYLPKTGNPPYPGVLFPLGHENGRQVQRGLAADPRQLSPAAVTFASPGIRLARGNECNSTIPTWKRGRSPRRPTSTPTWESSACCWATPLRATRFGTGCARSITCSRARRWTRRASPAREIPGGGTHTAYLAALDDRIKVAMPSCYITSWRRLLETIGPQDAEQCIPPWIGQGLDHGDFVLAFSPKPYLILSAIRDFFSINGARETYQEAQHVYSVMGAPDKVSQFEADNGHGYLQPRRIGSLSVA